MSESHDPRPPGQDDLRALARFAALDLSEERAQGLLPALASVQREHAALRALPLDLESHLVFDPRWD